MRSSPYLATRNKWYLLEPVDGLEPPTCSLQVSCSSSWAIPAYSRLFFLVRQFKRLFQNISCCMSLYLSYIILYKNFFEKSKGRKNPVLESSQTYSVRAEIHCLAAHYQPLSCSLVTVLPTKMLLEPLTIGYHIVQYGIFYLKSIFSLFIALLRHWGPHATSINNKIFRNLIN